jgi:hypothetical protein
LNAFVEAGAIKLSGAVEQPRERVVIELDETKECPDCAERIKAKANVCRFCGYRYPLLSVESIPEATPPPEPTPPPATPSPKPTAVREAEPPPKLRAVREAEPTPVLRGNSLRKMTTRHAQMVTRLSLTGWLCAGLGIAFVVMAALFFSLGILGRLASDTAFLIMWLALGMSALSFGTAYMARKRTA